VRQYGEFEVAQRDMKTKKGSAATELMGADGQSFNVLAGFLFGDNEDEVAMAMTTPVLMRKGGGGGGGGGHVVCDPQGHGGQGAQPEG